MNRLLKWAAVAAPLALMTAPVLAQDLRIGIQAEPSSMDPHFHNLTPNNQMARHIYEPLVFMDEKQAPIPGLAVSWRTVDDLTWEFKLRTGVKFHDGSDFTADDVIATWERAPNVPRSPSSFGAYIRGKTLEKVDSHTIRIRTATPYPLMVVDLAQFGIIPKACKDTTTEDFNAGRCTAGGTGPYRFVSFTPGNQTVMARNDSYWGERQPWARVIWRPMSADPTRVAALLAGDVDVIDVVPTADIARIRSDNRLSLTSEISARVIYFHMDHFREESPFITAKDGSKIKNPLRDVRVRRALSMAINRPAIVERIMEGQAVPAGQLLDERFFGTSKNLRPTAFDMAGARRLLAEAGFPNGFKMRMHGPNGRYTNDTKIIEAVAQMFSRIGIDTEVETMPPANFFSRASQGAGGLPEFSFILVGWSAGTGETSDSLKALLATFNREKGMGATNRGRYSNPEFDRVVEEALATVDDAKRGALLARASEIAMNDVGLIPTHYQISNWAKRANLTMVGRTDEYTLAMGIRPR